MSKEAVLNKIKDVGIVAVIRAESVEQAAKITDACVAGGVTTVELCFTVPNADQLISQMVKKYEGTDVTIGAGTVLDPATARIAILNGAQYIVSPHFDPEIIAVCNIYDVPAMAGVGTATEAIAAMRCGASVLKVFPGDVLGPKFIKSLRGPVPYAQCMPSGGVDVDNVGDWIKAGAIAVGAGSSLTAGAKTGDYAKITETGKKFIENTKKARA